MKVFVASPLHSYTKGRSQVEARGGTVGELLAALDAAFPGIRFRIVDEQDRIREHMRIYVGETPVRRLDHPLSLSDEVHILQALSGG